MSLIDVALPLLCLSLLADSLDELASCFSSFDRLAPNFILILMILVHIFSLIIVEAVKIKIYSSEIRVNIIKISFIFKVILNIHHDVFEVTPDALEHHLCFINIIVNNFHAIVIVRKVIPLPACA